MSKLKQVKLDPNSYYHCMLVKKYGMKGALAQIRRSNLAYIFDGFKEARKFAHQN